MPAITYSNFNGGLDRRLPVNVQDANRLWVLRDAYVTQGGKIKKRPGLKLVSNALAGSVGLAVVNGALKVFVTKGSTFTAPPSVGKIELTDPALGADYPLQRVYACVMFQGFAYVVADYDPKGVYVGGGNAHPTLGTPTEEDDRREIPGVPGYGSRA